MNRNFLLVLAFAFPAFATEELETFPGCTLVPTEWADGDSFSAQFPDGKQRTIRLYGADCIEMHVNGDDSNARRLRDQRRYFGIDGILIAKSFGEVAKAETQRILAKPFTVHTTFADGREQLADMELIAARKSRGAWAKTDWEKLPKIR